MWCVSTLLFWIWPSFNCLCLKLHSASVFWWTGYEWKPNLLGPFVEGRGKDHGRLYKSHNANKCRKCGAWVGSILLPIVNYVYCATSFCLIQPEYLYRECSVQWNIGTASVCNMGKLQRPKLHIVEVIWFFRSCSTCFSQREGFKNKCTFPALFTRQ